MGRAVKARTAQRANGLGSIFPLKGKDGKPSGRLRVQITLKDAAGKRHTFTKTVSGANTKDVQLRAEEALVALRKELDERFPDGIVTPELPKGESAPGTLGALIPEWMDHYFPTVESTTRDFYTANTRYIMAELGPLPLSSLTKYRVNEFLRDLKTRNTAIPRPLSTTAKRAVRRTLAMVIDYAMQFHPEMTLTTNPAREAKAPQATKAEADDEADQRWFDDNEVQQFFKAVHAIERKNADTPTPVHVGAAWAIQYHLGLRPGEVRALSWSDIDDASDAPTIYVGHGQKRSGGTTIARGTTKTRDSRRKLYVPTDLLPTLETHKTLQAAQRARYAPNAKWNPDNLIFTRPDGTPVSKETYAREFSKVCDLARIKGATPYALRHTFCTLSILAGIPLPVVAKMMGHKDLRMVTQVYGHVVKDAVQGYANVLPSVLATATV